VGEKENDGNILSFHLPASIHQNLKIYTKLRQWQPLPVIHTIVTAIHNESIAEIVTSIIIFGILVKAYKKLL
jgi:hypothetical protein